MLVGILVVFLCHLMKVVHIKCELKLLRAILFLRQIGLRENSQEKELVTLLEGLLPIGENPALFIHFPEIENKLLVLMLLVICCFLCLLLLVKFVYTFQQIF